MSNAEWKLQELRDGRTMYLRESDWVVTKALEKGESVPEEWVTYRQALRDITESYTSLELSLIHI